VPVLVPLISDAPHPAYSTAFVRHTLKTTHDKGSKLHSNYFNEFHPIVDMIGN
jgi:hypothetical protein